MSGVTTSTAGLREDRRLAYESARPDVQAVVPRDAKRILDLGCASGALGGALKHRQGAHVVGVELMPEYARDAEEHLDRVVCADVAAAVAGAGLGRFDCVICADVLEHLQDPWAVLRQVVDELLDPGGTIVVSVPNVRSWETIRDLIVKGRWPRRPAGLFDATHLRWFALADARELLESSGLRIVAVHPKVWQYARWQQPVVDLLVRTPLAPFFHGQYVLVGVKPG